MRSDRQTNKQAEEHTDTLVAILRTPSGDEVINT